MLRLKGSNLLRGLLSNMSPTRKLRPGVHIEIVKEKGKQVKTTIQVCKPCPEKAASTDGNADES